jgi:lipopolysaccharide export system permease protein
MPMLRTLHWFLARELAKVALLSLVAFTLVMTVFVIIEPMRKQGLSTDQVISFLGYTLPAMVSLTLPVAALFGATIVYGRFSQDNELLACRAGGVATLRLLEPALVLGVLVTAVSLWVGNYVTPFLAERAERAVKGDIQRLVYYQLRTQGYLKQGNYILYADSVDPATDTLQGVVVSATRNRREPNSPSDSNARRSEVTLMAADRVSVSFPRPGEAPYISFRAQKAVVTRTHEFNLERMEQPPSFSFPIPERAKDDPAWYSWTELVAMLRNPARNRAIERSLKELRNDLGCEMLVADIVSAVREGKPYTKLHGRSEQIELRAPQARQHAQEAELLAGAGPSGSRTPVVVRMTGARQERIIEADRCRVQAGRGMLWSGSIISMELDGHVRVRVIDHPLGVTAPPAVSRPAMEDDWSTRQSAHIGELQMPEELAKQTLDIDPNLMLKYVPQMSSDPAVLQQYHNIVDRDIVHLNGRLQAEMHGRLAYGVSCFLMVAMGAGLGLRFRGGQLLSAFVLSIVPAAVVIILIVTGKQLLGNAAVPRMWGLIAVWSGIAALIAGNTVLYARLART